MSRLFAVFVGSAVLLGLFAAPALVLTETVLQEGTELAHRARVFSVRDFLMRLTLLVSVTGAAWMVALTDTRIDDARVRADCAVVGGSAPASVGARAIATPLEQRRP